MAEARQGIEYHVRAILDAGRSRLGGKNLQQFSKGLMDAGAKMTSVGDKLIGNTLAIAKGFGVAAASMAVFGAGGAIVSSLKQGLEHMGKMETQQYALASGFQMMGMSGGDFRANLAASREVMGQLWEMVKDSPASFEQAQGMFQAMMPGASAVNMSLQDTVDLTHSALALAKVLGGNFEGTGQKLGMMLRGYVRETDKTWQVIKSGVREAGIEAGLFGEKIGDGKDLVKAFKSLSGSQRAQLIQAATAGMGDMTDAFGETWESLVGTMQANILQLKEALAAPVFEAGKKALTKILGAGGILDPKGETYARLKSLASFIGDTLGRTIGRLANRLDAFVRNFADNWEKYLNRALDFADWLWKAAKMLAKAKVAAVGVGVGAKVAGFGMQAGGQALEWVQKLIPMISKMGIWALAIIPAIALAGFALLGLGAIAAGFAVYVVDRWDEIVAAVRSGAVSFEPLFLAVDTLWVKLSALGAAVFGNADGAGIAQGAVDLLSGAIERLIGFIQFGLDVLASMSFAVNAFMLGLKAVYLGLVTVARGVVGIIGEMLAGVSDAVSNIPAVGASMAAPFTSAANAMRGAGKGIEGHMESVVGSMDANVDNMRHAYDYADAFSRATATGDSSITKGLRQALDQWVSGEGEGARDLSGIFGKDTTDVETPRGAGVNVHKMVVNQDLRNQDPDRVIGAMYRAVEKSVGTVRSQSLRAEPGV